MAAAGWRNQLNGVIISCWLSIMAGWRISQWRRLALSAIISAMAGWRSNINGVAKANG